MLRASAALALAFSLASCQVIRADDKPLSKEEWAVRTIHCPSGCTPELRSFLDSTIGKAVQISERRFVAPFADRCDGEVTLKLSQRPARQVLEDVNKGAAPGRKLTSGALPIARDPVLGGLVYCRSGGLDLPIANLLAVEPGRVLVLFEDQAIIELR